MSTIELIDTAAGIESLAYDWQQLNLPSPMQTPEWALAWWNAFSTPQDRLTVLAVRDRAGLLMGVAPWYRRTSLATGCSLRFLGDGKACSDFQTLLCRTDAESEVIDALVTWLTQNRARAHARWDMLDFDGVSGSDGVMNSFIDGMAARCHVTHRRATESTWRMPLDASWDRFLARQSKSQRSQIRNFVNRFDKGDFAWRTASSEPNSSDAMIQIVMDLHQRHWQSIGQPGCFASADMRYFFTTMMQNFLVDGAADIGILYREDRPVSALAWLIRDNTAFGYQCGRDPEEDCNRVGRISQVISIRWMCGQGYSALDFLRGDELYKVQLRAEPTACHRVRIVARAGMPLLRHNLWLACRDVKHRLLPSNV